MESCPLPGSLGVHTYSGMDDRCIYCGQPQEEDTLEEDTLEEDTSSEDAPSIDDIVKTR